MFKIDPKYVNERLFMFSDLLVDTKPVKKLSPFQQHFMSSYTDVDQNNGRDKKGEKKEKVYYAQEIVEYADILTTWVRLEIFNFMIVF